MGIKIDNLYKEVAKAMTEYSEGMSTEIKKIIENVAKETNETIKNHIGFKSRTGGYIKHFKIKTVFENEYGKRMVWYVASPDYRLTHLLEYGHAKRNGGRTRAYPHIKYGADFAAKNTMERIEELIRDGKT